MNADHPRFRSARQLIGQPRDHVPTPALILDIRRVQANLREMASRMASLPAALRPHTKIHKSPALGKMQVEAGAIGLTTATVWEAGAMVDAGLTDILIANQVVGPVKTAELARIAGQATVTAAVDSAVSLTELSEAATRAKSRIDVIVEVDVGLHRSGARTAAEAVDLGAFAEKLPGVRLRGLLGYEGHCMLEPDRALRVEKARAASGQACAQTSWPVAGSAHGISLEQTRGSPRSTPDPTYSVTLSTGIWSPALR